MSTIMSTFRRTNYVEPRRMGGGTRGNWREQRKLQKEATPFILIESAYADPNPSQEEMMMAGVNPATGQSNPVMKDFYRVKKHTCRTTRNNKPYFPDDVCAAGWDKHNPQHCEGCIAQDGGDKRIKTSDVFAYGFVHLVPYHTHPLYNYRDRQFVMKNDGSGPFMTESECGGRTCNFCRIATGQPPIVQAGETWPGYDPRSIATKFGGRRYFEFGKNHLGNLGNWADLIAAKCANIDPQYGRPCRTPLRPVGFDCPTCGNVVIDIATDTRNDEQLSEAVSRPYPCNTCRANKWLKQALVCDRCEQRDMDPSQFPLIGTVLHGARRGESTASTLVLDDFETLEEFHARIFPQFGQILGGKTVRQVVEEIGVPYDFDSLYTPRSPEEMIKRLDIGGGRPQQQYPQQGGYQQPQYPPPVQSYPAQQAPFQPVAPGQAVQQPQQGQPPPPFTPGRPNYQ